MFSTGRWGVMTREHTHFVAHLLAKALRARGCRVEILNESPLSWSHDWYIVLCAQTFKFLPPPERRIVFQLEQCVSAWFTAAYLDILYASSAVLDYSLSNIAFLRHQFGSSHPPLYYLPIGADPYYAGNSLVNLAKKYDVLFYGAYKNSARRMKMLSSLAEHCHLKCVDNAAGVNIIPMITQAKVVINLHYYQASLLEMPRLQESLSLGVPVVSEHTLDQDEYPQLRGAVRFFEEGSLAAMLTSIRQVLADPIPQDKIMSSVVASALRFNELFEQFMTHGTVGGQRNLKVTRELN